MVTQSIHLSKDLPPTGIEPTLFRNSASKVAGLQIHATALHYPQQESSAELDL